MDTKGMNQLADEAAATYFLAERMATKAQREEANQEVREHLSEHGHSFAAALIRIIERDQAPKS